MASQNTHPDTRTETQRTFPELISNPVHLVDVMEDWSRPKVLQYQVSAEVAHTLKDNIDTSLAYKYTKGGLTTEAYFLETDGHEAWMRIEIGGDRDPIFCLPSGGQCTTDLIWNVVQAKCRDDFISIATVREDVVDDLVAMHRPGWEPAVRALISSVTDTVETVDTAAGI